MQYNLRRWKALRLQGSRCLLKLVTIWDGGGETCVCAAVESHAGSSLLSVLSAPSHAACTSLSLCGSHSLQFKTLNPQS